MPLKFRFKAREEIPAEHQALYVERDGAWVLDVEGAVEKGRLDEFRSTNVALRREVDSLNTRPADNSVESMVLPANALRAKTSTEEVLCGVNDFFMRVVHLLLR